MALGVLGVHRGLSFLGGRPGGRVSRLLLIKLIGVGDTVLMLPAIKSLRERFPDARIACLATPLSAGILKSQPLIDEVIVYDVLGRDCGLAGLFRVVRALRAARFDVVIDFEQHMKLVAALAYLTGAPRRIGFDNAAARRGGLLTDRIVLDGEEHMARSFARLLGPLGIGDPPQRLERIFVRDAAAAFVRDWLSANGVGGGDLLVGVHPGSGKTAVSRRWPADRFARVCDRLVDEYGAKVILTGSSDDLPVIAEVQARMRHDSFSSAGRLDWEQLAALMERLALFIGNDTGPLHVASAMGTPLIGIFGPESPLRYGSLGEGDRALYAKLPCSPCIQVHNGRSPACSNPTFQACVLEIGVEDAWSAVVSRLGAPAQAQLA